MSTKEDAKYFYLSFEIPDCCLDGCSHNPREMLTMVLQNAAKDNRIHELQVSNKAQSNTGFQEDWHEFDEKGSTQPTTVLFTNKDALPKLLYLLNMGETNKLHGIIAIHADTDYTPKHHAKNRRLSRLDKELLRPQHAHTLFVPANAPINRESFGKSKCKKDDRYGNFYKIIIKPQLKAPHSLMIESQNTTKGADFATMPLRQP